MYGKEFYKDCIGSLVKFLLENGFTSAPTPPVHLHRKPQDEKNPFKQFTGFFQPSDFEIHLFLNGRHPKDVLRTLAHELVHVKQYNENRLAEGGADLKDDPALRECELEAFTQGNLGFREWTEQMENENFGGEMLTESSNTKLMKINENQKVTLTLGQLKKLVKESGGEFDPSTCKTKYFKGSKWDEDNYSMIGQLDDKYTHGYIRFTIHDDGDEPIVWIEAYRNGDWASLDISLNSLITLAKDAETALNELREMNREHPLR